MDSLTPVGATRPVAPYIGGKRNLSRRLVDLIGRIPHTLYAEPFVGMGGIFLRRDRRPPAEVINDISTDIVTLFRILQRHFPQFLDTIKWQLSSRAEFERLQRVDPETLTDLERAARFLILQRTGFGGKVDGRCYGTTRTNPSRFDLTKLVPMLEDVHERLAPVTIERLPWAKLIDKYDAAATLFYLDPPYFECEDDYGPGVFDRDDFAAIADRLARIEGSFVLSINDRPEVRRIFGAFVQAGVDTTYRLSGAPTKAGELIIVGGRAVPALEQAFGSWG